MKQATLIKNLQNKFKLNAVPASEFYGSDETGVWIRDDICKESTDWYNYAEGTGDSTNILNKFLERNGWFAEPYDSETIFVYEI